MMKIMGREYWEFLSPTYQVYIKRPIHSQEGKSTGEKYLSLNLPPSWWLATGGKTTYLISEFEWRNGTWAGKRTLLFLPQCLDSRIHTFFYLLMCKLFVPARSSQLASMAWMYSILVEGIKKPKFLHSSKSFSNSSV